MRIILLISFLCALLSGCGNATHLVYAHDTSMGIDVAFSVEGTGRMVFGYDRDTFSIVPIKKDGKEAMSLVSFSCIDAKGLDAISFNHFVSSGDSAKEVAKDPDGLKAIRSALYGGGEKCDQQ